MVVIVPGGKCTTIAIEQLARAVVALPLRQFMPLNEAFARAKDLLGSYRLAGYDLTQHARARRLTLAVRVIWPDRTEQIFILRPTFCRWHEIEESIKPGLARVCGYYPLVGQWHFFIGRRRFDRLYSTAVPSKPAVQEPPRGRSPEEKPQRLIVLSDEPQQEQAPKRRREEASTWLVEKLKSDPPKPGESKNKWAERLHPVMRDDFGDPPPWSETGLRRRMDDPGVPNPWGMAK
jgi:hypothetical protein